MDPDFPTLLAFHTLLFSNMQVCCLSYQIPKIHHLNCMFFVLWMIWTVFQNETKHWYFFVTASFQLLLCNCCISFHCSSLFFWASCLYKSLPFCLLPLLMKYDQAILVENCSCFLLIYVCVSSYVMFFFITSFVF